MKDKLRIQILLELNTSPKSKQHKAQQNKTKLPWFSRLLGKEVDLFHNAPEPTWDQPLSANTSTGFPFFHLQKIQDISRTPVRNFSGPFRSPWMLK